MSQDFKDLSLPLQKVIDLGEIDRWLRGVAEIVPQRNAPVDTQAVPAPHNPSDLTLQNFNAHTLYFGNSHLIDGTDIERIMSFRQLLTTASQQNVCVDITNMGSGHIEVAFDPHAPFSHSRIFEASYANVLPVIFGRPSK
jgi:hypothetical protein